MAIPLLAIPVIHSSGAWIASTATGYLAGTLSSTWLGAFVLGNSSLLGSLGLVSGAGILGSTLSGSIAAAGSSVALGAGSALSAVGLGGLASSMGLAPVATFLGVTPIGWAIIGSVSTVVASVTYIKLRGAIKEINNERVKGGLEPTTWKAIIQDIMSLESNSMHEILAILSAEGDAVNLSDDSEHALINGKYYLVARLKYVVRKNGEELLLYVPRFGAAKTILVIKKAPENSEDE